MYHKEKRKTREKGDESKQGSEEKVLGDEIDDLTDLRARYYMYLVVTPTYLDSGLGVAGKVAGRSG